MRQQNQFKVVAGIESYTKRTAIRHLKDSANFEKDEVATIYDKYFGALYYSNRTNEKVSDGMDLETFKRMLATVATWPKSSIHDDSPDASYLRSIGTGFIMRLYEYFKFEGHQGVTFQDTVTGLSQIMHGVRIFCPFSGSAIMLTDYATGYNVSYGVFLQAVRQGQRWGTDEWGYAEHGKRDILASQAITARNK